MSSSPLPILLPLAFSATIAAWTMLSLLGSERERRLRQEKIAQRGLAPAPMPDSKPASQAQRPAPANAPRPAQKKS